MSITEVPAYNRILVGTDGSLLAEPTIVRAAGLAAANGADVVYSKSSGHSLLPSDCRDPTLMRG